MIRALAALLLIPALAVGDDQIIRVNSGDVAVISIVRANGTVSTHTLKTGRVILIDITGGGTGGGTPDAPQPPENWQAELRNAITAIDDDERDLKRFKLAAVFGELASHIRAGTFRNTDQVNKLMPPLVKAALGKELDEWKRPIEIINRTLQALVGTTALTGDDARERVAGAFEQIQEALKEDAPLLGELFAALLRQFITDVLPTLIQTLITALLGR